MLQLATLVAVSGADSLVGALVYTVSALLYSRPDISASNQSLILYRSIHNYRGKSEDSLVQVPRPIDPYIPPG
jgi:hypothetical protein